MKENDFINSIVYEMKYNDRVLYKNVHTSLKMNQVRLIQNLILLKV